MTDIRMIGKGNFLNKELLYEKNGTSPRHFTIHFNVNSYNDIDYKTFSQKVKTFLDVLYNHECYNTHIELCGFQNGILLKSVIQDSKKILWEYDLTSKVIRCIMKELNLDTITVSHNDFKSYYYILDNRLNIVGCYEYEDGGC